jgi:hypothetical protein
MSVNAMETKSNLLKSVWKVVPGGGLTVPLPSILSNKQIPTGLTVPLPSILSNKQIPTGCSLAQWCAVSEGGRLSV